MFNLKNVLDVFKKIIVCVLVFGMYASCGAKSIGVVRQEQSAEAGIAPVNLSDTASKMVVAPYVQSQAQLQLPSIRKQIERSFGDKVVPYFDIVSSAIVREAELKKTHYVFYHAAPSIVTILSDLYTQLYFNTHPAEKMPEDDTFRFLRFQGESKDMKVSDFLAKEMKMNGLIDDSGALAAYLLSVNLALFGNVGSRTECTWHWFVNNERSVPKPDLCKAIMQQFGLSDKYVDDIMKLDDIIVTKEATLLQICIPHEIVDEIVYLAWIRGVPASGPIMDWIKSFQKTSKKVAEKDRSGLVHTGVTRAELTQKFKKEKEKNPLFRTFMESLEKGDFSVYAYLTAYCSEPDKLPNLNETEGRILFNKEGLNNPKSGIKFYRYMTTRREKLEEYVTKLNGIVEMLLKEKASGVTPQVEPAASVASQQTTKKPLPTVPKKPASGKTATKK